MKTVKQIRVTVLFDVLGDNAHLPRCQAPSTIDVAFVYWPFPNDEGFAIDKLVEEPLVAILPTGHRLSRSASLHLDALTDEKLIIFPRDLNPPTYDAIVSAIERAGFAPKLGQWASLNVAAVPMVAAGLGWSVVPQSFNRILPDSVAYVRIDDDMPSSTITVARRRGDRSTAVQNFVACARQQAREVMAARAPSELTKSRRA